MLGSILTPEQSETEIDNKHSYGGIKEKSPLCLSCVSRNAPLRRIILRPFHFLSLKDL